MSTTERLLAEAAQLIHVHVQHAQGTRRPNSIGALILYQCNTGH